MLQSDKLGKRVSRTTELRQLQRIVASPSFYCGGRKRFNAILIENKDGLLDTLSETMFLDWFAKVLYFLNFSLPRSTGNLNFGTETCCCADGVQENCFVQNVKVPSGRKLKMNRIDTVLNSIRLR